MVLGARGGDIQIIGTYFPCPCAAGTGHTKKLWDKTQAWLSSAGIHHSRKPTYRTPSKAASLVT